MAKSIGIVLFDGVEELDAIGRGKCCRCGLATCTGSLVYAAAGLLSHRPATTHWAALDQLAEIDPTIDIRRDERFVDDGDIVTAAGVSAGIDMALHLVVRLAGPVKSGATSNMTPRNRMW